MPEPRKKLVRVFAAGCFNRIHPAHRRMLAQAKVLGDELVVVLANDAHNTKPTAVPAAKRVKALEALRIADRVVVGRADGFVETLRREKPSILVLGYDQSLPDEDTAKAAREMGIEIVRLPWLPGREEKCP